MGKTGSHKLLCRFHGETLVRRLAAAATASLASATLLVTGHRREDIEREVSDLAIRCVFNSDYREGMASSLLAGLRAAMALDADAVMVIPADLPLISREHLDEVILRSRSGATPSVYRAANQDMPGNPVLIPRELFNRLLTVTGDTGAREIIAASSIPVELVDIGIAATTDVDTPREVVQFGGVL